MSQTKKHCEPLVAVWLRPSTTEPCICCKQVAEKPRGEHLKKDVYVCMYTEVPCYCSYCMYATVPRPQFHIYCVDLTPSFKIST